MSKAERVAAADCKRAWKAAEQAETLEEKGHPEKAAKRMRECANMMRGLGMDDEADIKFRRASSMYLSLAKSQAEKDNGTSGKYYNDASNMLGCIRNKLPADTDEITRLKDMAGGLLRRATEEDQGLKPNAKLELLNNAIDAATTEEGRNAAVAAYSETKVGIEGVERSAIGSLLKRSATFSTTGVNDASSSVEESKALAMANEHVTKAKKFERKQPLLAANHFMTAAEILINRKMMDEAAPHLERAIDLFNIVFETAQRKDNIIEATNALKRLAQAHRAKGNDEMAVSYIRRCSNMYAAEGEREFKKKHFGAAKSNVENAIKILKKAGLEADAKGHYRLLNDINSRLGV
jgi:hypothetical protein